MNTREQCYVTQSAGWGVEGGRPARRGMHVSRSVRIQLKDGRSVIIKVHPAVPVKSFSFSPALLHSARCLMCPSHPPLLELFF